LITCFWANAALAAMTDAKATCDTMATTRFTRIVDLG
jgi:hypothetical protein